ncbi:Type I restriction-modification system specificity subunit S [Chromobacterium vaccinii]|nr:Type I restriction-modification system specificity subunit S [Chromobacterium vaccinii]QND89143.1 Type I restriction-modification system specificity subunit S [Chromobacterium vaccinii]
MSLRPYAEYKDSGVAWLGEVPAHWEILQSRRMFSVRSEPARPTDRMLTASQKYGVLYQSDFVELEGRRVVEVILGVASLKHVEPDDFIISMRSFQGGIEWCRLEGSTSFHYVMLKPIKHVVPFFFSYLLKSQPYIQALRRTTDLIRDGQELRFSNFAQVPLPVIPEGEQYAISAFLEYETAKIDALIAEQEKLIALLAEKRQAVISHAVTKGLNPDAPMKDSGIAWLGEVPAHWEVKPIKYLVSLQSGGTPSKDQLAYWDGDVPWASAKDLKTEELFDTTDHLTTYAIESAAAKLVTVDSALVVVRGMILARCFPVSQIKVEMAINQDLKAVSAGKEIHPYYLPWLLRGSAEESLRRLDEAGHGTKALRMEAWLSMQLPVPPEHEQVSIFNFIKEKLKEIDGLTAQTERALELLRERRSSLISAAVTGKVDVRNWQIANTGC